MLPKKTGWISGWLCLCLMAFQSIGWAQSTQMIKKFEIVTSEPLPLPVGKAVPFRAIISYTDGSPSDDVTKSCTWTSQYEDVIEPGDEEGAKGIFTGRSEGESLIFASYDHPELFAKLPPDSNDWELTASKKVKVVPPVIVSFVLEPQNPSQVESQTKQLDAVATLSNDQQKIINEEVLWSSSNEAVATVGDNGLVSALTPGETTITATLPGSRGKSASTVFTVTPDRYIFVEVSPQASTMHLVQTKDYHATGIKISGKTDDLTQDVDWSSGNPGVAWIGNDTGNKGIAHSATFGVTNIIAKYNSAGANNNLSGATTLRVIPRDLVKIDIQAHKTHLSVGEKVKFKAYAVYNTGARIEVTLMADWESADPSVASVSNTTIYKGKVKAESTGQTTISATYHGVTGTMTVQVTD